MINNNFILDNNKKRFTLVLSESLKSEFFSKCGKQTPSAVMRLMIIDFIYEHTLRQKNSLMRKLLGSCVDAFKMENGALMEEVVKEMMEALKSV